jgi:3-oxoacyl-[acyl-carrier protein] reductase
MTSFAGKVAIVTGGGTGIGRATAQALAGQGAAVAVVYSRSLFEADETIRSISDAGGTAIAVQADIRDECAIAAAIEAIAAEFGGIDYLVNNAGITRQLPFADLDAATNAIWDELLAVNVKGTFNCCRAASRHMQTRPGSSVVNIGSIAGETGYGSSLPYAVSKAAVHGMTRSLARALAPATRVNCIAPGAVATRWWQGHEDKMQTLAGNLPLGRISTPVEVAELALYLLQASSVTGQIWRIENGQTL